MEGGREKDEAFVTLATNDTYALGCLVLGSSLRRVGTTRQLVVMITEGVSPSLREQLGGIFDSTVSVNVLDSSDTTNLELLGRPDLSVTFTKLHCWRLTQFQKCVFLDADTLVLQNIDELFDREELSAAPDAGWPDCFNSGVFVYVPSEETYRSLLTFAVTTGSFDGGDQGLLNLYFGNWATEDIGKHLPFIYNVVSQSFYTYMPALKQFYDNVKVIHFIGPVKPWHHGYNTATRTVTQLPNTEGSQEFLQLWWNIFMDSVQPHLDLGLTVNVRLEHKPPSPAPQDEQCILPLELGFYKDQGHQQHHHGHSDIRAEPTISYQVMYPYTPPLVDDWTRTPQAVAEVPQSKIVEVPVVYRDYKVYETHYTEEPLTTVNPENPPVDHYFASIDIKGPELTYSDNDGNSSHSDSVAWPGIDNTEVTDKGSGDTLTTEEYTTSQSLLEVSREEQSLFNLAEGSTEKVKGRAQHGGDDENGNFTEKGGIVGDLAHLTLSNDGGSGKSDFERRLQWEQGQADYLGVDKFDNIKARLDEKMAPVTPSGSKTSLEKEVRSDADHESAKDISVVAGGGLTLSPTYEPGASSSSKKATILSETFIPPVQTEVTVLPSPAKTIISPSPDETIISPPPLLSVTTTISSPPPPPAKTNISPLSAMTITSPPPPVKTMISSSAETTISSPQAETTKFSPPSPVETTVSPTPPPSAETAISPPQFDATTPLNPPEAAIGPPPAEAVIFCSPAEETILLPLIEAAIPPSPAETTIPTSPTEITTSPPVETTIPPASAETTIPPPTKTTIPPAPAETNIPPPTEATIQSAAADTTIPLPPPEATIPSASADTTIPAAPTGTTILPSPPEITIPPPPAETTIQPLPTEPIIPPTPNDTAIPPTPNDTAIPPTPNDTAIPPTPNDTAIPPAPTETTIPPSPAETTIPPTPTETAFLSFFAEGTIPPSPVETTILPSPAEPTIPLTAETTILPTAETTFSQLSTDSTNLPFPPTSEATIPSLPAEATILSSAIPPPAEATIPPPAEAAITPPAEATIPPPAEVTIPSSAEATISHPAEAAIPPPAETAFPPPAETAFPPSAEIATTPSPDKSAIALLSAEATIPFPSADSDIRLLAAEATSLSLANKTISMPVPEANQSVTTPSPVTANISSLLADDSLTSVSHSASSKPVPAVFLKPAKPISEVASKLGQVHPPIPPKPTSVTSPTFFKSSQFATPVSDRPSPIAMSSIEDPLPPARPISSSTAPLKSNPFAHPFVEKHTRPISGATTPLKSSPFSHSSAEKLSSITTASIAGPSPPPKPISATSAIAPKSSHFDKAGKPSLVTTAFRSDPVPPPIAPKPSPVATPAALKPNLLDGSKVTNPSSVAALVGFPSSKIVSAEPAKHIPILPPPPAPKPILSPANPQTIQTSPKTQTTEPAKVSDPKHKSGPFSLKKEEPSASSKHQSATVQSQHTPPKPNVTNINTKTPSSVAPKPLSQPGAANTKPIIAGQASKFEKPALSTPSTAASKTNSLTQTAPRFEPLATLKSQTFGASSKSPALASSQSTEPPIPVSKTAGTTPKGPATNREEMLARFGVRLPPPKK